MASFTKITITALATSLLAGCAGQSREAATRTFDPPTPIFNGVAPASLVAFGEDGAVAAGAPIVVGDPQGNLVSQDVTDGNGAAAVNVVPSGTITVASGSTETGLHLKSVLGVDHGMTITFGGRGSAIGAGGEQVHVTFAHDAEGAASYDLQTGCNTFANAAVGGDAWLFLDGSCNPADVTILVTARDGSGRAIGYAWANHVAVDASGSAAVEISGWRADLVQSTVAVTSAPAGTSWVTGSMVYRHNGLAFPVEMQISAAPDAPISASYSVMPVASGDRVEVSLTVYFDDGLSAATIERGITAPGSAISIDLGHELLPQVTASVLDVNDPANPVLSWTAASGEIAAQAAVATATWSDRDGMSWDWSTLAASVASAPSVRLPSMPSALAGTTRASGFTPGMVTLVQCDGANFASFAAAQNWTPASDSGDYALRTSWRVTMP